MKSNSLSGRILYWFFSFYILGQAFGALLCLHPSLDDDNDIEVVFEGVSLQPKKRPNDLDEYIADVLTPFNVKITLLSNSSSPDLKIDNLDNFHVVRRTDSRSVVSVNGDCKNTRTIGLQLRPKKEGVLPLGPFKFRDGTSSVVKPVVNFIVKEAPAVTNGVKGRSCMVALELQSGSKVFVWQPIKLVLKIFYMPDVIQEIGSVDLDVPDFEIKKVGSPALSKEDVEGVAYGVQTTNFLITPKKVGCHEIPPVEVKYLAREKINSSSKALIDPTDAFLTGFFNRMNLVEGFVRSNRLNVEVIDLPAMDTEINAIGSFNSLTSSLEGKTSCEKNEPIIFKLSLDGSGNFDAIAHPKLRLPPNVKSYPSKVDFVQRESKSEFLGKKTFEYILQIDHVGNVVIPEQSFEYFCPDTGVVQKVSSLAHNICVIGIPSSTQEQDVASASMVQCTHPSIDKNTSASNLDPLPIMIKNTSKVTNLFLPSSKINWHIFYLLLTIIFIGLLISWLQNRFASYYKRRFILRECLARLKQILMQKNFEALYEVLLLYFSVKLSKSVNELDLDYELSLLSQRTNLSEDALVEILDLLHKSQEISFGKHKYTTLDLQMITNRIKLALESFDTILHNQKEY